MKNLFLLALLILSCSPPVVFDQAFPLNEPNLTHIPNTYQDIFACESDSALIIINPTSIIAREEHLFKSHIRNLEEREDCSIVGNQLYIKHTQECVPLQYINDTIVQGTMITWDTLFVMNEKSVARLYKGHVVISQDLNKGQWSISLLSIDRENNITYKAINDKSKLSEIQKITSTYPINQDKDRKPKFLIKPSMKDFDALINNPKIFIDCEYLKRINLESSSIYIH